MGMDAVEHRLGFRQIVLAESVTSLPFPSPSTAHVYGSKSPPSSPLPLVWSDSQLDSAVSIRTTLTFCRRSEEHVGVGYRVRLFPQAAVSVSHARSTSVFSLLGQWRWWVHKLPQG